MAIKWQRGKYSKFYAKMKIRIGGGKDNTVDMIHEGDEFEYDGSVLKYAGAEIMSTQLRGAIERNWATPFENEEACVDAFVPTRDIAKSKTVNRDLSRVQRGGYAVLETDSLDEETVLEVSDRGKMEISRGGQSPKILTKDHNRRGMSVSASEVDSQDGVTIGRVRSAAKVIVDVSAKPEAAKVIENRGVGKPVLDRGKIVRTEGITIKTTVGDIDRSSITMGGEEEGTVVAKVRHSKRVSSEGIEVKDTSNIRGENLVNEASKPRKVEIDTKLSPKIRMARRIDPNFPADWSFTGRLADRLAAAENHGATPTFLEALYAAEGDQMRKSLEKAYPKQFGDK